MESGAATVASPTKKPQVAKAKYQAISNIAKTDFELSQEAGNRYGNGANPGEFYIYRDALTEFK